MKETATTIDISKTKTEAKIDKATKVMQEMDSLRREVASLTRERNKYRTEAEELRDRAHEFNGLLHGALYNNHPDLQVERMNQLRELFPHLHPVLRKFWYWSAR